MASSSSQLDPRQGFHSTVTTTVTLDGDTLDDPTCSLHATYSLPPDVFVDPYELSDQHHDSYTFNLTGLVDVELPVSAAPPEGQVLSLHLISPDSWKATSEVSVQVPIHARYGLPSETGYHDIPLSPPQVVRRCLGTQQSSSTETTIPIPLSPASDPDALTLRIPVADPRHLALVEPATAGVVLGAFLLLAYTLAVAAAALRKPDPVSKPQKYID
ncbi:hypothetical protein OE88DRAFT_1668459 [Heliocybe sulcata]|uniref:Protein PBN1 n=1 Tax=Heliocybe sulcata TaxID=5364 RepID=A0A5C3MMT7_9AGAM|nr:hypothetical protein OE88DRAFT_1668459 [Heliocybe sulcata]